MKSAAIFIFLCLHMSSAVPNSRKCPALCVCNDVMVNSEVVLQIKCFVRDLKEFQLYSLSSTTDKVSLTIDCESFVPVDLTDDIFTYLQTVESISMNNCKLTYIHRNAFRGLHSLRHIAIHSASNFHLQIHPDALKSVVGIEKLVLANSGLIKIPNLCLLSGLQSVNLTGNSLSSFKDTGLACGSTRSSLKNLHLIDISGNKLQSLSIIKFHGLVFPNIKTFIANDNEIIISADDNLFGHFLHLRILDLSRNNISDIPDAFIEMNTDIQEIDLSENNISYLPDDIFLHSKRLLQLQLQQNALNDTAWSRLTNLKKLLLLNLSFNRLTTFMADAVSVLTELIELNVANNYIVKIPDHVFQNQQRLRSLNIAGNQLHTVDNGSFYGLLYLTSLQLQDNSIYSMNVDILNSLTALTHINVSSNYLMDLPSLKKLSSLLVFDARNNILGKLPDDMFIGQGNVRDINLSNNRISELSDSFFISCESMDNLDLSRNLIRYVHPSLFMGLKLQTLLLNRNRIETIGKTFANMNGLLELNLSSNEIRDTIQRYTFPESLEMLDLSFNEIAYIRPNAFNGLNQIRMIDLRYNMIVTLTKSALAVSTGRFAQTGIRLDQNPLKCDCNLLWLKKWDQSTRGPIIVNLNITRCTGAYNYPEAPVQSIPEAQFLCQYEKLCLQTCPCCDYEACDCKYSCPSECECFNSADFSTRHYTTCSRKNLTAIDKFIPRMTTKLDISGNNLVTVPSHSFIGMSNLTSLFLNGSSIEQLFNRSFTGLYSLRRLYLDHNFIKALEVGVFDGVTNLQTLYLDHNHISYIQTGVFDYMSSLKTLRLSNNYLQYMDDYTSHIVFTVRDLTLFANPWSCNCILYFSAKFNQKAFINTADDAALGSSALTFRCINSLNSVNTVSTLEEYGTECGYQNNGVEDLTSTNRVNSTIKFVTHNSSNDIDSSVMRRGISPEFMGSRLKIFIPVIIASTLIIILVIGVICRRDFVRCWLFTKYKCKSPDKELMFDKSRHYDAFISYHPRDDSYVIRELALRLERGKPKYRLLVQHRDCPIGSSVQNFIENAVTSSHRVVIVLSSDYISDNPWLKFVVERVKLDCGRRLILVVLGKIDKTKLDPVMLSFMKTDNCIKYSDAWFWDKLFYALPEPGKVDRDVARAEAHPYASTDLARLSTTMMDNQAYEEPRSVVSRPLPSIVEYVPASSETSQTYDYAAGGSQHSSNIYEEIKDQTAEPSARYEEPWKNIHVNCDTFTPRPV